MFRSTVGTLTANTTLVQEDLMRAQELRTYQWADNIAKEVVDGIQVCSTTPDSSL